MHRFEGHWCRLRDAGDITALIRVTAALQRSGSEGLADVLQQASKLRHCPAASATTITMATHRNTFQTDALTDQLSAWNCEFLNAGRQLLVCGHGDKQPGSFLAPSASLLQGSHAMIEVPGEMPLVASQQLIGAGEQSGTFLLELKRSCSNPDDPEAGSRMCSIHRENPKLIVCSRTTFPWFLSPWIHTLTVMVDGRMMALQQVRDGALCLGAFSG